jgi:hypothetical protein
VQILPDPDHLPAPRQPSMPRGADSRCENDRTNAVTTRNLTLPIVAVIAALSARPAWAAGCMPSQPGAPYTILLEFAGHQDASYEIAGQSPVAVEVPPFQGAQTVRDEICERVAEDFQPLQCQRDDRGAAGFHARAAHRRHCGDRRQGRGDRRARQHLVRARACRAADRIRSETTIPYRRKRSPPRCLTRWATS